MENNKNPNAALENDPKAKELFSEQPFFVQESIMQSGAGASTETNLKRCAENLTRKQQPKH